MVEKKIYQVFWEDQAMDWLKNRKKINQNVSQKLYERANKDLSLDPYGKGKLLVGKWEGYRSYRYTIKYRVIYEVFENQVLVSVVKVGHRKEIYE